MNNWQSYNPNPVSGQRVGDCTVRAISKATGQDWETTYAGLSAYGFMLCDMPNANWGLTATHRALGIRHRLQE